MPMSSSMEPTGTTLPPDITRVSPELALVDADLARRLRARIPRKRPGHTPPLPILRLPSAPERDGEASPQPTSP
jgi:hypothetical protein